MTTKMVNRQSFQDGKVVLYQLEDRPKGLWLCRLKVPNGSGYVYRGTGTSDLYEARKFADDLLDELKIKAKLGEAITGRMFREMVADYKTSIHAKGSPTKREQGILDFLESYAVKYFTKVRITEVSSIDVSKFFDWRRKNPIKKVPTETTIVHETSKLRAFFDWCHKRGMITRTIEIENPKHKIMRRPHFDKKDWSRLTGYLHNWVKQGKNKSGPIYRDRLMLTNYILILANSGIRVGEARNLKWRDVESDVTQDGVTNIILHVKGKTGSREVVARKTEIMDYFKAIWDLRKDELTKVANEEKTPQRDDYIFCHKDGKPIHTFKKGFLELIQKANVEKDANGDRRTIYSLRHTYATFRLQEGVNHYVLAKNMGTSVKMLEQFYGHTSNRAMADELTKHKDKTESVLPWESVRSVGTIKS